MKSVTKFIITCVLLISSVLAHAVDPIGFERWTPLPSSYVEIGERCEYLQSKYNHPAPLIGPYDKSMEFDQHHRLIDIEIRTDITHGNVFDGVVVTNTGSFKRKSWLICDADKQFLDALITPNPFVLISKRLVLLDVEKYQKSGKERWVAIVQESTLPVESWFITDHTIQGINTIANTQGWRVLDIDPYGSATNPDVDCSGKQACMPNETTFSAVMIKNTGQNEKGWALLPIEGDETDAPQHESPQVPNGMQLVDREVLNTSSNDTSLWNSAMLFVENGKDYETLENLSATDVHAHNHSSAGVVIDIEWTETNNRHSPGVSQVLFHTVNARQF